MCSISVPPCHADDTATCTEPYAAGNSASYRLLTDGQHSNLVSLYTRRCMDAILSRSKTQRLGMISMHRGDTDSELTFGNWNLSLILLVARAICTSEMLC